MNYSRIQKSLSSLLIFSILISFTIRIPFNGFDDFNDYKVFADEHEFHNIVSVIVEEWIYADIKDEINRYAKDIQWVLENTKVVILPTPKITSSFNIASLNESLYFEWYKWVDNVEFDSKLIWTVLVWELELPVVYDNNNSSKTILPYVDFEDKEYIYNHQIGKYEKNKENKDWLNAEIWHGVISPNFWDDEKNIQWLKDYFDKNHDFYQWTWNFKLSNGILNWNILEWKASDYEPYVFYYDGFREQKALNYNIFEWYKSYINNKEDLVYNRFNKDLANKIKDEVLWKQNESIYKLVSEIDQTFDLSALESWMDLKNVPDIQTRLIIKKAIRNFLDVFSKWSIWDFRKNVHNAWRYNDIGSKVNVDLIPFLITVLDLVNDEVLKDMNSDLENHIDDLVSNWLSRKIEISLNAITPKKYIVLVENPASWEDNDFWDDNSWDSEDEVPKYKTYYCNSNYTNFFYWKLASKITSAKECSVYLWSTYNSWTLVEATRWLNIKKIKWDVDRLKAESMNCLEWIESWKSLNWYWGKNSPLNIDHDSAKNWEFKLKDYNLKWSIEPLFDIAWSKKIDDALKNPSPLNCLENNFMLVKDEILIDDDDAPYCKLDYSVPINWASPKNWTCNTVNTMLPYAIWDISYKYIPSIISHKSPTSEELTVEINSMVTSSLPIDRDRYVDFIAVNWSYAKINYPYLFRVKLDKDDDLTLENTQRTLNDYLNKKSDEINNIIISTNTGSIINPLLMTWDYPSGDFNLISYLKNKTDKVLTIWEENKNISYYDTLSFAVFWNNLNSVSAKYKFIFENYLSDEFWWNALNIHLPKNKKQYEIAYLGAEWDSENMYIKMDPEDKGENPYSDIISKNLNLAALLMWDNIWWSGWKADFNECAPPEWVPIWEWIPAIICRLWNMLPPTISIWEWECWWDTLFLSEDEKDEIKECNWDFDKNWINDCIEKKLGNWKIELYTDVDKYYYNKAWKITARILDNIENWNVVKIDNTTNIDFELSKLVVPDTDEVIYDVNDPNNNDLSKTIKYVNLNKWHVKVTAWEATYGFVTKNLDVDIYINASIKINDNKNVQSLSLKSNILKVLVRWDRLFTTSYRFENNSWELEVWFLENSLKVNNESNIYLVDKKKNSLDDVKNIINNDSLSSEKLVIFLENLSSEWENLDLAFPLTIKVLNGDKQFWEDVIIEQFNSANFKSILAIKKSWTYTLEIMDNLWFKILKIIEILPEIADNLDISLWTTIIKSWWESISTNLLTMVDKFGNPSAGHLYNIELSIDWNWLVFESNNEKNLSLSTIDWYKIFRLKSTDEEWENTLNIKMIDLDGNELFNLSEKIRVIDNIELTTELLPTDSWDSDIKVWWWIYKYDISLKDSLGNILTDFNSRAYLGVNKIYWEPTSYYVDLKNWKAILELKTSNVAWKNIPIEFQVEWLWEIIRKQITILPEKPIRLDISLSKSKIEANVDAFSILKVELKDRYWNLVFNDNTTSLNLEILDNYSHIIRNDNNNKIVRNGVANFKLYWTSTPWSANFKVSALPWFEDNGFIVIDERGEIVIEWVSDIAWRIETFYFWNKDNIEKSKYNAIYTTLLWASYWDIDRKNYLAWSLLFNKDNRSLSVTSLLNNPYSYNDIVNIDPKSGVNFVYNSMDLTQDIEALVSFDENNKLNLNLYNASLNTLIGKILFNFDDGVKLKACEWDIFSCWIDEEKTSILINSLDQDYNVYYDDDKLILQDVFWKKILEIDEKWNIRKLWIIDFEFSKTNNSKNLLLNIKTSDNIIWTLLFNFVDARIDISRDEERFNGKVNSSSWKNSILLLLNTNSYGTRDVYNLNWVSKVIYFNDPFRSKNSLNSFSRDHSDWYENFAREKSLWWLWSNKSLLSFSAWKSVWESVKDYHSFSVINLWDPVISLKKIKKNLPKTQKPRNFDSTVWELLSNDDDIVAYQIFDYNNDSYDDILLIKNDNLIKLLENTKTKKFLDMWNLVNIIDFWNKDLIKTWNFTWDSYDDIFFVNNDWEPFILNNNLSDFLRIPLKEQFNLKWRIIRAEVFDMDNDLIDDVVTLDEAWEINIFYGWGSSESPEFTKINLTDSYWIKLSSDVRNDNSFVYFDWLYSMEEGIVDNSEILASSDAYMEKIRSNINDPEFLKEIQKLSDSLTSSGSSFDLSSDLSSLDLSSLDWGTSDIPIDDDLLDKLIFVKIKYWKNLDSSVLAPKDQMVENLDLSSYTFPQMQNAMKKAEEDIKEFTNTYPDYTNYTNINSKKETTFIKWEYSELEWLKVEKVFTNINNTPLKSGDIIKVDIKLINTGNKKLENVAYLEKLPLIFTLNEDSISIPNDFYLNLDIPWYDFLVDGFSLDPDESITISYNAETKPLKYWYLKLGLFEEWELWNDEYWDVIVKDSYENCSKPSLIFTSIEELWSRNYKKWIKELSCNEEKSALPDAIEKNTIDLDWNWIPDYIDDLKKLDMEKIQKFSDEWLDYMHKDSDSDWIPDREDNFDSTIDITSNLATIDEKISGIMDWMDTLVSWLNCWFGWGWCIASPLNWAPLAPGWSPTLFWFPIMWLHPTQWIPIFSFVTVCPPIWYMWPICPIFAWGMLPGVAIWPFRLFVTPTLTWAIWVAACFWPYPAWWIPIPWISPIISWWNCVVAAAPLLGCSDDGSDWDVWSIWFSDIGWGSWDFDLINWNCYSKNKESKTLSKDIVKDYFNYKGGTTSPSSFKDTLKKFFDNSNRPDNSNRSNASSPITAGPLLSINEWWEWQKIDVEIDTEALKNGDFSDVIKITKIRIPSFPEFLTEWATRQLEEISTKLTDFPTVFIILPDFSWIFDLSWGDWWKMSWNSGKYDDDFETANKALDDFEGTVDDNIDNETLKSSTKSAIWAAKKVTSGIKEAYEFLANIPLVKIKQETVNVSVPWIDEETINKTIAARKNTVESRKTELKRAKNNRTLWMLCEDDDKECEDKSKLSYEFVVKTESLISSLEANLEILNDYKEIPKKINKMINVKQRYLSQILCNIETISFILWWRIWKNGKRFKAWVELYVLIKAILKSWQLLMDIFIDYDMECVECDKNERFDLYGFIFKLISMIIPKAPIIIFPKWPDIVIDLHNIRAWINITLPEYKFWTRPILLPMLPELKLPDLPSLSLSLNLPKLKLLPTIEIPELPDLPTLPTIKLPDLPPPPTLPKLIGAIEGVLKILKLVTKIMCFLRSSFLIPEWKTWDQIAFMTERPWYLWIDFMFIDLPQFSMPFVDAIKVTTFVNFELDVDFLVELARQSVMPINTFPNDFSNIIEIPNLDFSDIVPSEINVEIWPEWIEPDISQNKFNKLPLLLAIGIAKNIWKLVSYMDNNKSETLSNLEFRKYVNESLSSKEIVSDPKTRELRELWDTVNNMTYSKEDKFIKELKDNSNEKFETLKDIINTEIIKTKKLKDNLDEVLKPSLIKKIAFTNDSDIDAYNSRLIKYNDKFIESANTLRNLNKNVIRDELKEEGNELIARVKTWLKKYSDSLVVKKNSNNNNLWSNLLAAETTSTTAINIPSSWQNSCQRQVNSDYKYEYKWLYVLEDWTSYRLFDYLDELYWDEKPRLIDFDNDSDDDLMYIANWELFLKENLKTTSEKVFVDTIPLVLDSDDNKFYNGSIFYESVNNVREIWSNSHYINMNFSNPTRKEISNYRVEFYDIVNKFLSSGVTNNQNRLKSIIDSFVWIDDITFIDEWDTYISRKNLAYINEIWIIPDVKLKTKELINIKSDLDNNNIDIVNLSVFTKLYASNQWFTLNYKLVWVEDEEEKQIAVSAYQNIELKMPIQVISMIWNAYIEWDNFITLEWENIRKYLGKPLFPESNINYIWNGFNLNESSHIEIEYYDLSEALIDFRDIKYYYLYDLWSIDSDYSLTLNVENNFYYARMMSFKEKIFSTDSKTILLSPQKEADTSPPVLSFKWVIRVPVYQKKVFDLSQYIYEDSWIHNITEMYVDFDLETDSDNDFNPKNDSDTEKIVVTNTLIKKEIEFWEFDTIFKRKIWITMIDDNNNKSFNEINFEVYSPKPVISNYELWIVTWVISEELNDEPVSLYRNRWWSIRKLEDINGEIKTLTNNWNYNFSTNSSINWLILKVDDEDIATINENTWKINFVNNLLLTIDVLSSNDSLNDSAFPKIILNKDWVGIYSEYVKFSTDNQVKLVNGFEEISDPWVYINLNDWYNYSYYKIPEWVNYNPWSLVIYDINDINKKPLFTIFKDWRINTIDNKFKLEYSNYWDYIIFKLMDEKLNNHVADVLFKVEGDYVIQ